LRRFAWSFWKFVRTARSRMA